MPATVASEGHDDIDLVLELLDLQDALWTPTLTRVVAAGPLTGVVLAEKAAGDLGVGVGDTVVLTHPQRQAWVSR